VLFILILSDSLSSSSTLQRKWRIGLQKKKFGENEYFKEKMEKERQKYKTSRKIRKTDVRVANLSFAFPPIIS
jgi:hypothetical protein